MNKLIRIICLTGVVFAAQWANAQTASTSGVSNTSCNQSSNTLVCTTTTTVTLPSGTNLSGMALTQSSAPIGPGCNSLVASPNSVPAGVTTAILLTVNGCPTSDSYNYKWGTPVSSATGVSTTHALNLSAANPSQAYSVTVCSASNSNSCANYTASVNVQSSVPALSGCAVTPANTTVTVGGTTSLSASCSNGTGSGSGASYQWLKNNATIAGANSAVYNVSSSDTSVSGTTTFSVQVSNSAPSSLIASATVTIAPAPPPLAADNCPSSPVRVVINASEGYRRFYTYDVVTNFTANDNFVVALDVAAGDTTAGRQLAGISFSDAGSNRGGRYVTVSQTKCDYSDNAQWISSNFLGTKTPANGAGATVSMAESQRYADIKLTPGRWYINIQNVLGYCGSNSSCHAVVQWAN